jgi:hypothetical protein
MFFIDESKVFSRCDLFHLFGEPAYLEPCRSAVSEIKIVFETSDIEGDYHIYFPVVRDDMFKPVSNIAFFLTALKCLEESLGISFVCF